MIFLSGNPGIVRVMCRVLRAKAVHYRALHQRGVRRVGDALLQCRRSNHLVVITGNRVALLLLIWRRSAHSTGGEP